MLRGVSSYSLASSGFLINEELFAELSCDLGVNVFRLALYTKGIGAVGYCSGGDTAKLRKYVTDGVEFARAQDMYAIIDWHILDDGDPNTYVEEARVFFDEMSAMYRDYDNVIYEICNEPNGVGWDEICSYANEVIPDAWTALLEEEGISYCMWSFSKVAERCSAITSTCMKNSGFAAEDYTATGLWLIDTLNKYK